MARKKIEFKEIDGKKYYTSTYFARQKFVSSESARHFLQKYESLENHSNPKLYSEAIMAKALKVYNDEKFPDMTKEEIDEMLEMKRVGEEEDYLYETDKLFLSGKVQNDGNEERDLYDFSEEIRKEYDSTLLKVMMDKMFYILGYEFDEKNYKKDFEEQFLFERFREMGEPRSKKHRDLIKRLDSKGSYLIEIVKSGKNDD
ncbi:hypothetical protein NG859_05390 [Enterococcus faecalis]|uniref:hypothetical protein n=1 Tax=Enterococcus faecalis TaxID=1351 RepID=UPI0019EB734A|nr:hypothetical protein [Enterococcus faecalis]EGO9128011.1 hypothetical protein [Enterococcus faecalis]MCO5421196.1 hypothetical protein [Enterococcus faecalis]